jgi:hypothetical protein
MPLNATGKFDLTNELERQRGHDPQRHEKARFLAETRELRIQLAIRTNAERILAQRERLPAILRAVACDDTRPLEERKAILEAMLDEMNSEMTEGRAAGDQIRALLSRWPEGRDAGSSCP